MEDLLSSPGGGLHDISSRVIWRKKSFGALVTYLGLLLRFHSQYGQNWVERNSYQYLALSISSSATYCLGAVVLTYSVLTLAISPFLMSKFKVNTLKASGVLPGFRKRKSWVTSLLKGPDNFSKFHIHKTCLQTYGESPAPRDREQPTLLLCVCYELSIQV